MTFMTPVMFRSIWRCQSSWRRSVIGEMSWTPALHRAGHVDEGEDVQVEQRAGLGVADLLQRAEQATACVVDQHVDPAEPVDGGLDGGRDGRAVGDVEGDGEHVAGFGEIVGNAGRVADRDDDVVVLGEGGAGDLGAEPAGCSSDEPGGHDGVLRFRSV
ncbi:hypothetical protein GCM10010140_57740 [Streptosporangium pseudovulgare]|uniref:Uncharacterized protein n=1 Tax=Streptosporangium pseudovulgare TaxID=35765 RepID=A0ABQ2R8V6_9ACTN|nr:hypothetical protein [Streptosporangium pseudovulgare]GGQ19825.1 hypothetical protein GCM10010140_57740 [Streptosporangium pseudovulgare]